MAARHMMDSCWRKTLCLVNLRGGVTSKSCMYTRLDSCVESCIFLGAISCFSINRFWWQRLGGKEVHTNNLIPHWILSWILVSKGLGSLILGLIYYLLKTAKDWWRTRSIKAFIYLQRTFSFVSCFLVTVSCMTWLHCISCIDDVAAIWRNCCEQHCSALWRWNECSLKEWLPMGGYVKSSWRSANKWNPPEDGLSDK